MTESATAVGDDGPIRGGVQPGAPEGARVELAAVEMGKGADLCGTVLPGLRVSAALGQRPRVPPYSTTANVVPFWTLSDETLV